MSKNYAKGVFTSVKETSYGPILNVDIKLADFIMWLKDLPVNEKGYVKLQASPQKDKTKWSFFENTYNKGTDQSKDDLPF